MDVVLNLADHYFLDDLYAKLLPYPSVPSSIAALEFLNSTTIPGPYAESTTYGLSAGVKAISALPRDNMLRQAISLWTIAVSGSAIMYFIFSTFSYYYIFDRRLEHHPRFLKNQISMEIKSSMIAMPAIGVLTLPIFLASVRGKSLLYDDVSDYGYTWLGLSTILYMLFNDVAIYWIHRIEHHPRLYKYIHKVSNLYYNSTPHSSFTSTSSSVTMC